MTVSVTSLATRFSFVDYTCLILYERNKPIECGLPDPDPKHIHPDPGKSLIIKKTTTLLFLHESQTFRKFLIYIPDVKIIFNVKIKIGPSLCKFTC